MVMKIFFVQFEEELSLIMVLSICKLMTIEGASKKLSAN